RFTAATFVEPFGPGSAGGLRGVAADSAAPLAVAPLQSPLSILRSPFSSPAPTPIPRPLSRCPAAPIPRMFVFVIYAIAVWYFAARWRRSWRGLAVIVAATGGLLLVAEFHTRLEQWTPGSIYLPVLRSILAGYGVVVVAMAMFVFVLPRRVAEAAWAVCGYDLSALEGHVEICPECGGASPRLALATQQAQHAAQREDGQRQAGDQPPAQRAHLRLADGADGGRRPG